LFFQNIYCILWFRGLATYARREYSAATGIHDQLAAYGTHQAVTTVAFGIEKTNLNLNNALQGISVTIRHTGSRGIKGVFQLQAEGSPSGCLGRIINAPNI